MIFIVTFTQILPKLWLSDPLKFYTLSALCPNLPSFQLEAHRTVKSVSEVIHNLGVYTPLD